MFSIFFLIECGQGLKYVAGKVATRSLHTQSLPLALLAMCLCPSYDSSNSIEAGGGAGNSATSGLVGDFHFSCVAPVPASVSMMLVMLLLLPAVVVILRQPHVHNQSMPGPVLPQGLFLKSVAYGAMTLFMCGYHVHEKAILVTILPLTVLLRPSCVRGAGVGFSSVLERERWHGLYLQVCAGGVTGLLPLLMNVEELALKGERAAGTGSRMIRFACD